ncbi:galactosylceramide sulfotransferase-like [Diadema antillarum]|uniref:galactosylceramide sulfotransferase-like n=1 Tax=Diadema antillarum TaxID=105358 RepID=UPI003A8A4BFD
MSRWLPRSTILLLIIAGSFMLTSLLWMLSLPSIRYKPRKISSQVKPWPAGALNVDASAERPCRPQRKVAFLKTHKTGSSTVSSIFQRYGFLNNLTFLVPDQTHFINYRDKFSANRIQPNSSSVAREKWRADIGFDLLTNHVRYNRSELDKVFHGAKYVTIMREPGAQFESAFYYFEIFRSMPRSNEPLKLFLSEPRKYFDMVMQTRQYFKDSMHNQHLFDFGMSHDETDDEIAVRRKIIELDVELDLVMITEYFDESLLLLRKLLCWEMSDILYLPKATRSPDYRTVLDDDLRAKILSWNRGDVMLYQHFNRSFWRKVKEYGPTFPSDLAVFRQKLKATVELCCNTSRPNKSDRRVVSLSLKDNASEWCHHLNRRDVEFTDLIRRTMMGLGMPTYKHIKRQKGKEHNSHGKQ